MSKLCILDHYATHQSWDSNKGTIQLVRDEPLNKWDEGEMYSFLVTQPSFSFIETDPQSPYYARLLVPYEDMKLW